MIVLTSVVYVICAIIPFAPYHITPHLPDLFECFTLLATLKDQIDAGKGRERERGGEGGRERDNFFNKQYLYH